jgi:uncharacterized membrane protein YgcG
VAPTAPDYVGIGRDVPEVLFDPRESECSLGNDALERVVRGKYVRPGTQNYLKTSYATSAFLQVERWSQLQIAFLAQLMEPGIFVAHKADLTKYYYVVDTNHFAAEMTVARMCGTDGGFRHMILDLSGRSLPSSAFLISDPKEWFVLRTETLSPQEAANVWGPDARAAARGKIWIDRCVAEDMDDDFISVFEYHAWNSFTGFGVMFLRKLLVPAGATWPKGKKPSELGAVIKALIDAIIGDAADEETKKTLVKNYRKKKLIHNLRTAIRPEDEAAAASVIGPEDEVEGLAETKKSRKREEQKGGDGDRGKRRSGGGGSGGGGGGAGGDPPGDARPFLLLEASQFTGRLPLLQGGLLLFMITAAPDPGALTQPQAPSPKLPSRSLRRRLHRSLSRVSLTQRVV